MSEPELVRQQGGWVFAGSIANSILGFAFWALAAHLFTSTAVGTAGALVSLSSLATSIGILGLDNGLVRFAARVDRPRALMWQVLLVGGVLSAIVGLALSATVLQASKEAAMEFAALVALSVALTTSQTCFQITDGSILAARKTEYLAYRAVAYGLAKIALVFAVAAAGVVGLFGSYTLPLLAITVVSFFLVRRAWPARNEKGVPTRFRELASLSGGNWIHGLTYSLPSRLGPSILFIFVGASPVAYFFIALQLAEVLNYIPESVSKSLFAHGSLHDRLPAALTSSMRRLLAAILIPMVALGVLLAPFGMTIVGGTTYGTHALALQLFLLATLPKAGIQLYKAQFNVDRRPVALIVMGSTLGVSTLAFMAIGLVLRVDPDWLPLAWVLGGVLALGAGWWLSRGRSPSGPGANATAPE
jgi:O-antigen/teichoic acid export membrane protein